MGFWRFQGLVILRRPRAVPGHAKSLKNVQFLSFFKKNGAGARVLSSTFSFFDESFGKFACFCSKFGVAPQLGLQRQVAPKGAPKASQGVPKGFRKDCLGSRAGVIGSVRWQGTRAERRRNAVAFFGEPL